MTAPARECQPEAAALRQHTPTPWRANTVSYDIYADNVPKGPMKVADIRGWGYLTGKGHGALGLSYEEASQIQQANALLIVEAVNNYATLQARVEELTKALSDVRQELWVDYCLRMGRTDTDPKPFASKPHIRIIDGAIAMPLESRGGAT